MLGAWFVVVAVLRHRRDRSTWILFAVTALAVVGFAVVQGVAHERFTPLIVG